MEASDNTINPTATIQESLSSPERQLINRIEIERMSSIVIGTRVIQVGIVIVLYLALAVLIFKRDVRQGFLEGVIRLYGNPVVKAAANFGLEPVVTEATGIGQYLIDEDIRIGDDWYAAIQSIQEVKLCQRSGSTRLDQRKNRSDVVQKSAADQIGEDS